MRKKIAALGLLLTLMLPTLVLFAHECEDHEHIALSDKENNIQQTPVQCEICTLQLTLYDYDLSDPVESIRSESNPEPTSLYAADHADQLIFNFNLLRGPPIQS